MRLEQLEEIDLLILVDWGIANFSTRAQNDFLKLFDNHLGTRSMIIVSQLPLSHWHDALDKKMVADAIMDRIADSAYLLQLSGESLRKIKGGPAKKHKRATAN